jgi:hypothetical protein
MISEKRQNFFFFPRGTEEGFVGCLVTFAQHWVWNGSVEARLYLICTCLCGLNCGDILLFRKLAQRHWKHMSQLWLCLLIFRCQCWDLSAHCGLLVLQSGKADVFRSRAGYVILHFAYVYLDKWLGNLLKLEFLARAVCPWRTWNGMLFLKQFLEFVIVSFQQKPGDSITVFLGERYICSVISLLLFRCKLPWLLCSRD